MQERFKATLDLDGEGWNLELFKGIYMADEPPARVKDYVELIIHNLSVDNDDRRNRIITRLNDFKHFNDIKYIEALTGVLTNYIKNTANKAAGEDPDNITQEEIIAIENSWRASKMYLAFDVMKVLGYDLSCNLKLTTIMAISGPKTTTTIVGKTAALGKFIRDNRGMLKTLLCKPHVRLITPRRDFASIQVFVNSLISCIGWQLRVDETGLRRDEVILDVLDYIKFDSATAKYVRADG